MLPKDNRITEKADFELVKERGEIIHSNSFSLAYYLRNDNKPIRFGFIVSTKISPHATIRNRAKRGFREATRRLLSSSKPGYDCVFLAKPIIVKTYTDVLMREVGETLRKAQIVS